MVLSNFTYSSRRLVIFIVGLIFISTITFLTIQYLQSIKTVEVIFKNVSSVKLVEFRTLKEVGTIENSGDSINIRKDTLYKLIYQGKGEYSDGEILIGNKSKITIQPYYSTQKLDELLTDSVIEAIHEKINQEYTDILDEYSIQKGKLYHYGDWYSTTLTYKQDYNEVSDTLTVIVKKTPQGWNIAADPNITFDKLNNPTIPVDILDEINN
jgi:hypothetical protein